MAPQRGERPRPLPAGLDQGELTRRALLRTLGFGVAAATVGLANPAVDRLAAAQATPGAGAPAAPKRAPGGPDLDQLLWSLAFDPQQIFRFVADQIAYEAYSGVLRGAKGTFWSLAGNAVDQALLLAAMLTQAQVTVRFAAGPLNDAAASKLLASLRINESAVRTQAARVNAGSRPKFDQYPGLTPAQRAAVQSPAALRTHLLDRAKTELTDGLTTIKAALAAKAIALPTPALALPARERSQHVWVQYADGPRWVDLDPSMPGAEAGQAYAKQTATWDAIPDELFHRVRFRAIVEKNVGGTATREDAFVHEVHAADLVGVPVVFAHVDPSALKQAGVAITGLIEGTQQYVPSLLAGKDGTLGTPIVLGTSGGGVSGALGTSAAEDQAIGEWLELTVLAPDGPPQLVTREVFDRVGVDRRAAGTVDLASLPPVELVHDPQLGTVFLPLVAVWLLGVVGGRVPASYFDQDYTIPDVEADMALLVHGYHAARDALQIELAAAQGYRWYHDQPNLTAAILAPVKIANQFKLGASLDVIHQGYGVVPLKGVTPSVHPRVLAGVLAHVAERTGAEAGAELTPDDPPPAGSVAQVFEAAARTGVAIRTLTSKTADLSTLAISGVAKARITEALTAGFVVIVPERAVALGGTEQVGWWQVEPATGRTFDLMETGRGQDVGEDTVILVNGPAWRAALLWKRLFYIMSFIIGFSVGVALALYPN